MVSTFLVISALIAILAIGIGAAYTTGALDPLKKELAIWFFKAKTEAEAKKLQAQGLKEGEDFMKGDLDGAKQADDMKEQFGDLGGIGGGLKKGF